MMDVPTISELDAKSLEIAVLRADNAQLQARVYQMAADQYREQAKSLVASLEQPGFTLARVGESAWAYQPTPRQDQPNG
jgi:hypothetical protein